MKTPLLSTLLALALSGATVHAQDTPPIPPTPPVAPAPPIAPPIPPVPPKHGKAVITINVDGHQETREIDLGNASVISLGKNNEIKIRTDGSKPSQHREKTVWLGLVPDEVSESLRAQLPLEPGSGLVLRSVVPDGPAAKAGLQKNDVLTKFDDQLLTGEHQLHTLVKTKHDGEVVHLGYIRRGQPAVAEVTLGTHEQSTWTEEDGGYQFSYDNDDHSDVGERISKDVNIVVKSALRNALGNLEVQSKAIVMDKAGKMVKLIGDDMPDVTTVLDTMDKAMRNAGVSEQTIQDTNRRVVEATQRNQHGMEKAQEGLKKAADGLKKAADAQAKSAGSENDELEND